MKMRSSMIFLFYGLMLVSSSAQNVWSLSQCVDYSLENNLTIKNGGINQKVQSIQLSQERLNRMPQVTGSINGTKSFGRAINPATNEYSDINTFNNTYGINASMTLFAGFAQQNRIAFERYNLRAESSRVEQCQVAVAYDVIDAYFNLLYEQGAYQLSQENLKIMEAQYRSIQKFISVGRRAESDLYEVDAKLAADSFLVVQKMGSVDKAMLVLKSAMNFPVTESLQIDTQRVVGEIPLADSLSLSTLMASAEKVLPNLSVTENEVLASKKRVAVARSNFSPSLTMLAGWSTNYYKTSGQQELAYKNQLNINRGEYVGLQLNIPIFSRFSKINGLRTANLEYLKAQNLHLENKMDLERRINETFLDWQAAKNEYTMAYKQLEKSKIAYLTAERKLEIGQISIIDFSIQKNELLKSKNELLRTNLQLALKERYIHYMLYGKWEL